MSLLSARDLRLQYGKTLVQEQISFDIEPGVIFAVMGGSGCGKSTLLKSLIGLLRPSAGQVLYTQQDYWASNEAMRNHLRADIGVLFQSAALWSSMSVLDNVRVAHYSRTNYSPMEALLRIGRPGADQPEHVAPVASGQPLGDRKSTRLNSSH